MEPFASPNQLDPELNIFLEGACSKLCKWFAHTNDFSPSPIISNLPEVAPESKGLPCEALLDDLQIIMDGAYRPSHPGALAHLDPPPLTSSIVADLICSGLNNNLLAYELSPGFSKLERKLCEWLSQSLGFTSPDSGGVFTSGGTISNLMALVIARKSAGLQNDPDAVVLASEEAHVSLLKAIRVMGLSKGSLNLISTNQNGQISLEALHDELKILRKKGRKCFAIVATAGTTVRGSIDPLIEISEFCMREGLWMHVDGAIGGVFALSSTTKDLVKGISSANSVSINPQKLLGIAKTSSVLLLNNRNDLMSTFSTGLPYVEPSIGKDFHGGEIGLQGTRPADVLKLWLGLRQLGKEGIQCLLEQSINRRLYLQKNIDLSKLDIVSGPLHLIAITPKEMNIDFTSKWSEQTRLRLLEHKFMLSRPFYKKQHYLKVVLGNPHTENIHLDKLSELLNQSVSS